MNELRESSLARSQAIGGRARCRVLTGVLWHEWLAQRRLIVPYVAAWAICVWVLAFFTHPGWHLAFGLLYAMAMGARFGGTDVFEGTEEFSFGLPPTRSARYWVRLGLGLGVLLAMTVAGLLATRFSVPQGLWRLLVNSGFTEPSVPAKAWLSVLAVVCPAALLVLLFGSAALCRSRGQLRGAWAASFLACGGLVLAGLLLEVRLWGSPNGLIVCPLLALVGGLVLIATSALYARKEGVGGPLER
jgi:hypothetical protein